MIRIKILIVLFTVLPIFAIAQNTKPVTVYQKQAQIRAGDNLTLYLGFAAGDLITLKFKVVDDKNIREVGVCTIDSTKMLFEIRNKTNKGVWQYQTETDEALQFNFKGLDLAKSVVDIEITRTPATPATIAFDTRVFSKTITEEFDITYEDRKQTSIKTQIISHKAKLFDSYAMQEVSLVNKSGQLKGVAAILAGAETDMKVKVGKPVPPVPDAKLKYVGYYANSAIGGSKHWAVAKTAIPFAAGFVSSFFVTPAGGAAIGAGTTMMMDAMGPRPDGEPTLMFVASNNDLNKFNAAGSDPNQGLKVVNEGSGNSYIAVMTSLYQALDYDENGQNIVLSNFDPIKAKNYRLDVKAMYYAPIYVPVTINEKKFIPVYENTKVTKKFKQSNIIWAPAGINRSQAGEAYVTVEYIDTVWAVTNQFNKNTEIVSLVPRIKRVKSQVTTKSEMIYNQSFAAMPTYSTSAKIRLPKPVNDYYQEIEYKQIKYTLTVGDASYNELKKHISTVIETGITYGISKGTGKLVKKVGGKKIPGDESASVVEKLYDAQQKYKDSKEVIETTKKVHDIYKNGEKEEEEENEEGFVMKNGKTTNIVLKKVTGKDHDVTQYIPEEILNIKMPSVTDIADGAAGLVTPKIKDKINFKITVADGSEKIIAQKTTGFLIDSINVSNGIYNYNFNIDNPREVYDLKNMLSVYIFGSLMVEVEFEQTNYKDMVYYEEYRTPVPDSMQPVQTYTLQKRLAVIPKSEIKPWHKVVK